MKIIIKNCKLKIVNSRQTRAGFTLIETLVSLAIFSASIVALISITASGVANTNFAKNKFTASYLAQEGVEMVRNIRDTTFLSPGGNWNTFKGIVIPSCGVNCKIDPILLNPTPCTTNIDCSLRYNNNTGFYEYANVQGQFNRYIRISEVAVGEVRITSTVNWNQGSVQKSVTITENLFDWIQ